MFLSKYGEARVIRINVPKAGSANHAVGADWTPAAGDVTISKDGGVAANVTNLPTAIAMGNSAVWAFSLTATEMQAAQINVVVADAVTKAVDDTGFVIETYGNASAQHAFDLDTASVAQTGDNFARLGAPAGASVAADVAAVKAETASIQTDTNDLQTRVPAALVGGRMDSSTGAMAAGVITAAAHAAGAIDSGAIAAGAITAAKFAANAVDAAALSADAVSEIAAGVLAGTVTELGAVPVASPTVAQALALLYMALRNRRDTEAASDKIHNDAGVVIGTATVSDNGTVFTKAKYA